MAGQTNIGGSFYIAVDSDSEPVPQNSELTASQYDGLTWLQVPNMGQHGDTGVEQNMVTYSTWDNRLAIQQKGEATGASAEVRFLDVDSAGLTAMKAAGAIEDLNNYAFKLEWPDGRIEYNRGLVGAPTFPKGANEDFAEAVFMLALNQEPVFDTAA